MTTSTRRLLLNLAVAIGGGAATASASSGEIATLSSIRPPRRRAVGGRGGRGGGGEADVGHRDPPRRGRKLARPPPPRPRRTNDYDDDEGKTSADLWDYVARVPTMMGESSSGPGGGRRKSTASPMIIPLPPDLLPPLPPQRDYDGAYASDVAALTISPRIIGGSPAPESRYPYVASLLDASSKSHVCGGTLVAPDVVLTAGHCSGFFDSIMVGIYDIVNDPQGGDANYDHLIVREHRRHPEYSDVILSDFALAKLYGSSMYASPVRINNRRNVPTEEGGGGDDDDDDDVGTTLRVMGWGDTITTSGGIAIDGTSSDVLNQINVTYISNEICQESTGMWQGSTVSYYGHIKDNMMCAIGRDVDACKGDSGGPLILPGGDSPDGDVQVGIISWGLGCALETFPGVYSRISWEYDWIAENVCDMSSNPPSYLGCPSTSSSEAEVVSTSDVEDVVLVNVTIAIELDSFPEETSYLLEVDKDASEDAGVIWRNDEASATMIDGESHVPFRTFASSGLKTVTRSLRVAQNVAYRLTLLDASADGLMSMLRAGEYLPSRFRMCYGVVGGDECLNASLESDLIVCYGTGDFALAKSISCPVNLQNPPTFAPFEIPLDMYLDDDRLRPTTPEPTFSPSNATSPAPSPNSTFIDGTTYVGSTFGTKPTPATPPNDLESPAVPVGSSDGAASNATDDESATKIDSDASSSFSRSIRVTSTVAVLTISTVFFAV